MYAPFDSHTAGLFPDSSNIIPTRSEKGRKRAPKGYIIIIDTARRLKDSSKYITIRVAWEFSRLQEFECSRPYLRRATMSYITLLLKVILFTAQVKQFLAKCRTKLLSTC